MKIICFLLFGLSTYGCGGRRYRACFQGPYTNATVCGAPMTKIQAKTASKGDPLPSWIEKNRDGERQVVYREGSAGKTKGAGE